jgi:hypothetical protein
MNVKDLTQVSQPVSNGLIQASDLNARVKQIPNIINLVDFNQHLVKFIIQLLLLNVWRIDSGAWRAAHGAILAHIQPICNAHFVEFVTTRQDVFFGIGGMIMHRFKAY